LQRSFSSLVSPQLLWKTIPVTVKDGTATVSFDLSDSVTSFRAIADVLTNDGLLGQGETLIDCQLPTYAEVKVGVPVTTRTPRQNIKIFPDLQLPLELTVGDIAKVPVAVVIPGLGKGDGAAGLVTLEYRTSNGLQVKDANQAVLFGFSAFHRTRWRCVTADRR
jgi:hypothetical protein